MDFMLGVRSLILLYHIKEPTNLSNVTEHLPEGAIQRLVVAGEVQECAGILRV